MPSAVDGLKQRFMAMSQPDADGVYRNGAAKRKARTELPMGNLTQLWNEACEAVSFDVPATGIGLGADDHGIVSQVLLGDWSAASGFAAGRALLAQWAADHSGPLPTAVFTANDHMALGLLAAFHAAGVEVPADISVVGFDDIAGADYFIPPLTTIRQNFDALGHQVLLATLSALAGEAELWGLDLVYAYDGSGPQGQGDVKFQTEYLRAVKDLDIQSSPHPELIGSRRTFTTDGLYAQALYGIAPRWTVGVRYDVLGLTNAVSGGRHADYGSSDRWTLNLTWNLSEFSQLRAQYARNAILVAENERERFDAVYLQFLMSLGSHGAHAF